MQSAPSITRNCESSTQRLPLSLDQFCRQELVVDSPKFRSSEGDSPREPSELIRTLIVGKLEGILDGRPLVSFAHDSCRDAIPAETCVSLDSARLGSRLVLLFEGGDARRPIIMGVLQERLDVPGTATDPMEANDLVISKADVIEIDCERLAYNATKEIVLRCGKASIQLLSDGSVRIRGTEVLNRASGTNRIRGGNVQIN